MLSVKIHLTLVGLLIVIFIIEKYPVTLYLILDLGSCNNSVGCYFANSLQHETESGAPVPTVSLTRGTNPHISRLSCRLEDYGRATPSFTPDSNDGYNENNEHKILAGGCERSTRYYLI